MVRDKKYYEAIALLHAVREAERRRAFRRRLIKEVQARRLERERYREGERTFYKGLYRALQKAGLT
jgi:hypothetical protein